MKTGTIISTAAITSPRVTSNSQAPIRSTPRLCRVVRRANMMLRPSSSDTRGRRHPIGLQHSEGHVLLNGIEPFPRMRLRCEDMNAPTMTKEK